MRCVVRLVGLVLLVSTSATGADRALPLDAARMERRGKEQLEWNRKTLRGAYDAVGKRDARWDAPAREALELAAQMFSQQLNALDGAYAVHDHAMKAIDAGCDDPMILYLRARNAVGKHFTTKEAYLGLSKAAADAMASSRYPAFRRATALTVDAENHYGQTTLEGEGEKEAVVRRLDDALALLATSVAEDPRGFDWESNWDMNLGKSIRMQRVLSGDDKLGFDRVDSELAKVKGVESLRLALKGEFLISWAWKARTNAVAGLVDEARFRTFGTRLADAGQVLEAAYKANPDQPHVARRMLDHEKGLGGDRETMERWFARALKADGDDYVACVAKLDWLDPKWHGDGQGRDMLAFGEACGEARGSRSGIPRLAGDAHFRYASYLAPEQRGKYLASPEVWPVIERTYSAYLEQTPQDDEARSKFAMLCFMAGRYDDAHAQFQAVGDRLMPWTTTPNIPIEAMKKARDYAASVAQSGPRAKAKP